MKEERLGLSRAGDRLTNVADQTTDQRLIVRFPEALIGLSRPQKVDLASACRSLSSVLELSKGREAARCELMSRGCLKGLLAPYQVQCHPQQWRTGPP